MTDSSNGSSSSKGNNVDRVGDTFYSSSGRWQSKSRPRLLLVDDHPMFLRGLKLTLQSDSNSEFEVVGEASNAEDAIKLAFDLLPDVVLLDINLPGGKSGFDVCRQLKLKLPQTAVIILSVYEDDEQVFNALKAGASAYSPKDVVPEDLFALVQRVAKGSYPINDSVLAKPGLAKRVLNQFHEIENNTSKGTAGPEREIFSTLTNRELNILECIAKGQSNKEIALTLIISDQTVKNHITNILRKLNANDRTQAVMLALRQGWIRLSAQEQSF